jgi:hypothetical protein
MAEKSARWVPLVFHPFTPRKPRISCIDKGQMRRATGHVLYGQELRYSRENEVQGDGPCGTIHLTRLWLEQRETFQLYELI